MPAVRVMSTLRIPVPMTTTARKRDACKHAGVIGRLLAPAMLGMLVTCLVHGQVAPAQPQSAQQEPPQEATQQVPASRGLSAPAARDAAAAQLEPVTEQVQSTEQVPPQPVEQEAPAQAVGAVAADAGQPRGAVLLADGMRVRGVLFRVTPPAAVTLPAEAVSDPAATPAASPPAVAAPAPPGASYLLGTIHFGTPAEQGIDYAELEKIADGTETFVNEADIDEAWKPEYDGYRWLPVEQPLSSMIGKERIATAHALLPSVRAQDLERMKPWSVLALLEARGESGGDATMDARLQRIAAARGKRMVHLETLEQQLQALDCVPAGEHARVLEQRLQTSWILRIESAEAMAHYRGRNLEAWLASIDRMEGLDEDARAIEQRSRRCLLEDRNARWIGQLETLFQEGPCLVAVGAVHLVGVDGLIAALRRDGYKVEALPL